MTRIFLLCLLSALTSPALAAYKCFSGSTIVYSDVPCAGDKQVVLEQSGVSTTDSAAAKQRAERDKQELKQLENARHKREASEEKEQKQTAKQVAAKRKKCATLAQRRKWSEEDAASASIKSHDKAKRKAHRATEKYELECGK